MVSEIVIVSVSATNVFTVIVLVEEILNVIVWEVKPVMVLVEESIGEDSSSV